VTKPTAKRKPAPSAAARRAAADAKRAAKPKPALQQHLPPQEPTTNNNEGSGMTATQDPPVTSGSTTEAATSASTNTKKPGEYHILKTLKLDLSDPVSVATQLQELGRDGELLEVWVPVGTEKGANPKKAIETFGADNDMAGDYKAAATKGVKDFPKVSTATKRTVSFD